MRCWIALIGLTLCVAGLTLQGAVAQDSPTGPVGAVSAPGATPVNVGFLLIDGVYNSELTAPWDIFHHTRFHASPGMRVFSVGRTRDDVTTFEGLRVNVEYDLATAPRIDVLVVPAAEHSMDSDLADAALIDWVRTRGQTAQFVVSLCDGAFLLAEAGLLKGRHCTTFPGDIAALRQRYPRTTVVEGVSFVADGQAVTGVGGAKSFDPAMYVVERLYGASVARNVGRGMVIDWDVERVRHLIVPESDRGTAITCFLPGEELDADITVEDKSGRPLRLEDLVASRSGVRAVVLTIIAGASGTARPDRGGLWCEDSFAELPTLKHLRLEYGERGALFIGVMCPPVYHEREFGYRPGAFLRMADDHPTYLHDREAFVTATERVRSEYGLPFDLVVYDPRFRLLARARRGIPPGATPPWQGRFKWFEDDQTYGTPTTWVLTPDLRITGPPFFKNVYESDGRKLRYTVRDMERMLERVLGSE